MLSLIPTFSKTTTPLKFIYAFKSSVLNYMFAVINAKDLDILLPNVDQKRDAFDVGKITCSKNVNTKKTESVSIVEKITLQLTMSANEPKMLDMCSKEGLQRDTLTPSHPNLGKSKTIKNQIHIPSNCKIKPTQ